MITRRCWPSEQAPSKPLAQGQEISQPQEIQTSKAAAPIVVIRADALHKLTTGFTCRFPTIGIEDLNVRVW